MSYESVKLANSPDLYYRLDMVGPASDGDSIPDSSTNNLDGEANISGSNPAISYGYPSPIETDGDSRAFFCHNDPLVSLAEIVRASNAAIEPTDDFTLEAWLRPQTLAIDLVSKEKSFDGTCFRISISTGGRFVGAIRDSAGTEWTVTAPAVGDQDALLDQWWYVVLVRFGDALSIYVDGTLRNTTTVASGLPTLNEPGAFKISGRISGDYSFFVDEVALSTFALTGTQIREQYEAALFALNMSGQCDIRTSATLSGADEPDPAEYSFRHNWSQPVVERFRWRTGVFKPTDGPVGLTRQRSAVRRQVEYQHLLYSEKLRRQFEARAFAGRTSLVQFEPDKVQVESLASSVTSASFDTRYRDFEVGHRVLIYQDDDTYEFQTLTTVTDDGIEWAEGLSRSYTRPWIKPARVARLPREQQVEMQNDVIGDSSTIYEYQPEDEPFTPRRIIPFSPTLFHHGREVFDVSEWQGHDYGELPTIEYVSDRGELDDEAGVVSSKQYRSGSDTTQPYNMNLYGRELIARYLGWLYYRSGQYQPFWMPTFKQDLRPLARSGNVLLVEGHEYANYYSSADTRQDLAFIYFDGSMTLRRIESSVSDDTNDALSLDSATPTFTGLRWLSFLRRVILSSDDVEIAWETDDKVRVAFAVVDAPMDIAIGSPSVSPSPSASLSHSVSPSASGSRSLSPSSSASPSASISPTISPSSSPSQSSSSSISPSGSTSPSHSASPSV